jgi:hypothetical protein
MKTWKNERHGRQNRMPLTRGWQRLPDTATTNELCERMLQDGVTIECVDVARAFIHDPAPMPGDGLRSAALTRRTER